MGGTLTSDGFDEEVIPAPQSPEEYQILVSLVSSIGDFPRMNHQEQDLLIRSLEAYECYQQVDKLLRWRVARPDRNHQQHLHDYLWLMKVHYLGLDSFDSFLEVAKLCVTNLQIPFSTIRLHLMEEVLGPENFREHLLLMRGVLDAVQDVTQKVLLLERTALVCEKKLFLEGEVEPTYNQILKISPNNEKARKYRKLHHIHNMEWADAAEQLKVLAQHAENPQERVRYSHELAQLFLYNLNQPAAAIDLLRPLAIQNPETRHALIEAYERLELDEELISTLLSFERTARDPQESAHFKFRRGNGLLKMGRADEAAKAFREALQLQPGALLIHEALVAALVEIGSAGQLSDELLRLRDVVQLDSSKVSLDQLIERVRHVADAQTQL